MTKWRPRQTGQGCPPRVAPGIMATLSQRTRPMKKRLVLAPAMLALGFSGVGLADEAGLRRCRGIADAAARLACYDALVLPAEGAVSAAPTRPAGSALERATKALVDTFGMESKAASQIDRIESHIPGRFEGWKANSMIRLANGQVWQVVDGSWLFGEWNNPKVVVRRGMLGSFHLDIEGENRAPRVRRVQ
jgi:hypothetical protein